MKLIVSFFAVAIQSSLIGWTNNQAIEKCQSPAISNAMIDAAKVYADSKAKDPALVQRIIQAYAFQHLHWVDENGRHDPRGILESAPSIADDECFAAQIKSGFELCLAPPSCGPEAALQLETGAILACCQLVVHNVCFAANDLLILKCLHSDELVETMITKQESIRDSLTNFMYTDDQRNSKVCSIKQDFFTDSQCNSEDGHLSKDEVKKYFAEIYKPLYAEVQAKLDAIIDNCFDTGSQLYAQYKQISNEDCGIGACLISEALKACYL